MRRNVQHARNRGENYNQLHRAVSYADFGKLRFKTEEEQWNWSEASRLLTNCILYFYVIAVLVSALLTQKLACGDTAGVEALRRIALATWGHINLHGRFEFTKQLPPIDLTAIVQRLGRQPIKSAEADPTIRSLRGHAKTPFPGIPTASDLKYTRSSARAPGWGLDLVPGYGSLF